MGSSMRLQLARACLTKGGVNDLTKAARLLLDEFRGGKLGRITLEMPAEIKCGT